MLPSPGCRCVCKVEYTIDFTKELNGQRIDLNIAEGDHIMFGVDKSVPIQEFTYQGIVGRIYLRKNERTQETTLNLIWLNPPKQRISIYLTQMSANDRSPEDLIEILKSMRGS